MRRHGAQLNVALVVYDYHVTVQLRTIYRRTAFQRDDSNAVRISLDTSLQMFREEPNGMSKADAEAYRAAMDPLGAPDGDLEDPRRS